MEDDDFKPIPIYAYLEELRTRLIRCSLAVVVGFCVCLGFSDRIFHVMARPIVKLLPNGSSLVYTNLPDPFFMYLKIAFVGGAFLAFTYVLYEVWTFIRPRLHPSERRLAAPILGLATFLFYAGMAFCYFLVFPATFQFFLSFETASLKPMIAIREYVSLIMVLMLGFGVAFETPIILLFLGLLGIVDSALLRKGRRYFLVIAFAVAAVLTPTPDPFNQTLMAVPMILLYELGIRILSFVEKRRHRLENEEHLQPSNPAV